MGHISRIREFVSYLHFQSQCLVVVGTHEDLALADSVGRHDSNFDSYFVVGEWDYIDDFERLVDLADSNSVAAAAVAVVVVVVATVAAATVAVVVAAAAAIVAAAYLFDHVPDEKYDSYFVVAVDVAVVEEYINHSDCLGDLAHIFHNFDFATENQNLMEIEPKSYLGEKQTMHLSGGRILLDD